MMVYRFKDYLTDYNIRTGRKYQEVTDVCVSGLFHLWDAHKKRFLQAARERGMKPNMRGFSLSAQAGSFQGYDDLTDNARRMAILRAFCAHDEQGLLI